MCIGTTHQKKKNYCVIFENTREEKFFPNLSFPSETLCVLTHENNMPVITVGPPHAPSCYSVIL
jgi:hypothetical protein